MRLIYWHNLLSEFIAIAFPIPPPLGSNEVLLKLTTVIIIIIVAAAVAVAVVAIAIGRRQACCNIICN